jgi:hypothetical protein
LWQGVKGGHVDWGGGGFKFYIILFRMSEAPGAGPASPPAPERRRIVVPIAPGATSREIGQIEYNFNTPEEPTGIFSFTYYYRHRPSAGNRNVQEPLVAAKYFRYVKGMTSFLSLTTLAPFLGWKLVIYTDNNTLSNIENLPETPISPARSTAIALLTHPSVIVARCEWPEYSQLQTTASIDGVILRVLRHKAMMDFSTVPVLIRDADTYFDTEWDMHNFDEQLHRWESLLFQRHIESGKLFLVTGSPSYERRWHRNARKNFDSPGLLAGLVNCLPGIEEWRTGALWEESIRFIRGRCSIILESGVLSDILESTYIGKDEQIIIFIWVPVLLERTFFFYFDYASRGLEAGYYLGIWANPRSKWHPVFAQLTTDFPGLNQDFGESPSLKQFSLSIGDAIGTPTGTPPEGASAPVWTPPTREQTEEKYRRRFEQLVQQGKFTAEDAYVVDMALEEPFRTSLLNPFVVEYAFRKPFYNRVMYLMFRLNSELYHVVCQLPEGGAGGAAGGHSNRGGGKTKRCLKGSKRRSRRARPSRRRRL